MSDANNKLDKLDTRIDNIDVTLAKQQVILEEHMRRSIANEAAVDLLRTEVQNRHDLLMEKLEPLTKYADRAVFVFQIAAAVGGLSATILTVMQIIKFLKG